jgi:hypothetical protein
MQPDDRDGELSEQTKRRLLRVFDRVTAWRRRMQDRPAHIAAGSSLTADDEATHPYLISQSVHGALVSSVDHLDALRTLIQDAHVVHARAPFTLLRAALENSATAVWLLAPGSRDERVLRRLRLQWADFLDRETAERLFIAQPEPSRADRKAELHRLARARGLSEEQVTAVTSGKVTYSSIVAAAAREGRFLNLDERTALACWMAASGIAHARLWAVLSPILHQVEVPGAPEGSTGLQLSASEGMLTLTADAAALMTGEGWRLLDQRRQNHIR